MTYPEDQGSSLRTVCSPRALLARASGGHGTFFYRNCTRRRKSCPRFMSQQAQDMTQLCLRQWRLGNRHLHFYRLSCLPFYFFSSFVFGKGQLSHPWSSWLRQQILLLCQLVELRLKEPPSALAFDLARARSPPTVLSRVWSRAAWACQTSPAQALASPRITPAVA